MSARGMTLLELLLASGIGFVIILALGHVDVTRIRMSQDISERIQGSGESSLAIVSIVRDVERADRVRMLTDACTVPGAPLTSSSCVQIRIPEIDRNGPGGGPNACPNCTTAASPNPCCFNIGDNYRWVQYRFNAGTIERYDETVQNCNQQQTFTGISGLTVSYVDEAQAPLGALGAEPLPGNEDNNMVQVVVQWPNPADPATPYTTLSQVALRATPYTNVPNGLDVSNPPVSPPPGPCT